MAKETLAPSHGDPKTRKIHRHAQFPKGLIQDLVPTSTIDRITLVMDDATGKILRAEARLLGDYAYRNIIIDDPWILGAFNQAETDLKLAKSRRNDADAYPSELIVLEAKVVECEIRIEECYHMLYTLKASAEGALVTTPGAPITTAWQGAAVPPSKLDRLRTQRDGLRARSDSLLANIPRQTNHGSVRTRETSADKKAAAAREYDWAIAANQLDSAELQLDSAMLGRRYPDQAATVEQTEAKIVEAGIQVEERRHVLYSLKAVEPSHGEATGPPSTKIGRSPAAARPAPSASPNRQLPSHNNHQQLL